jgi:hypothetical protein
MSYFNWEEDFKLNVARGKVRGASMIHKFGAVPEVAQSSTGTVWDKNTTLYPWSAFDTAGVITASIANASDNGKQVLVQGLDANYEEVEEIFTLSSTATVAGTVSFKRVFRAFVTNGSASNVGDINFTKGGTDVLRITAGKAQTLMAIYTVPAGKTGYLYKGVCTAQASADATGDMFIRYFGQQAFRIGHSFEVSGGSEYDYEFSFPIRIPEKSDIDVRVTVRSNKGRYTAAFDILLLEENNN